MKLKENKRARQLANKLNQELYFGQGNEKLLYRICYMGYFDEHDNVADWAKSFTGAFLQRYPQYTTVMTYISMTIGKKKPDWSDMTKSNLIVIMNKINSNVCAKSARLYTKVLKACLNEWKDEEHVQLNQNTYKTVLSCKDEPSIGVYLNEEEVRKLDEYTPTTVTEKVVKAMWLCEYYLGGRRSDLMLITDEMINRNHRTITYVSQKTKSVITVPLHDKFLHYFRYIHQKEIPTFTYYDTIRRICKKAGINEAVSVFLAGERKTGFKWEFIGSHTARRSYACNLYHRGCDIYTISKRMGHSSVKITETYIVAEERELPQEVIDWVHS